MPVPPPMADDLRARGWESACGRSRRRMLSFAVRADEGVRAAIQLSFQMAMLTVASDKPMNSRPRPQRGRIASVM